MAYLLWRVMAGLHKEITISFLLVGHSKFSSDWCFGLLKWLFTQHFGGDSWHSTTISYNYPRSTMVHLLYILQLYQPIWFKYKGITELHHFRFTAEHPGSVFVKTFSDNGQKEINLLSDKIWTPVATVIRPLGLSLERQWYLNNKMWEFCSEESRDLSL